MNKTRFGGISDILDTSFQMGCGTSFSIRDLQENSLTFTLLKDGDNVMKYQPLIYSVEYVDIELSEFYNLQELARLCKVANGVQIFTGLQSPKEFGSDTYYRFDIDIEVDMIIRHPEIATEIVNLYRKEVIRLGGTPCIVQTKSHGKRLVCYTPGTTVQISIVEEADPDSEETDTMMIEFFSFQKWSRWDKEYHMLEGNLLNAPRITESAIAEITEVARTIPNAVQKIANKTSARPVFTVERGLTEEDIEFAKPKKQGVKYAGISDFYPVANCRIAEHKAKNNAVRYYLYPDGSITGWCYNCKDTWLEKGNYRPSKLRDEYVDDDALNAVFREPKGKERLDKIVELIRSGENPIQFKRFIRNRVLPLDKANSVIDFITEEEQRQKIQKAFYSNAPVVVIIAPTGSGKTTIAREVLHEHLAVFPTRALRDEWRQKYQEEIGLTAYAWLSYKHGLLTEIPPELELQDSDKDEYLQNHVTLDNAMCWQPVKREAVDKAGLNSNEIICQTSCKFLERCEIVGYKSQMKKAKGAFSTAIALDNIFTSKQFEGFMTNLITLPSVDDVEGIVSNDSESDKRTIFKDEMPSNYFYEDGFIRIDNLIDTLNMWGLNYEIGEFCNDVIGICRYTDNDEKRINALRILIIDMLSKEPDKYHQIVDDFKTMLLPCKRWKMEDWYRVAIGNGKTMKACIEKVKIYDKEFYVAKDFDAFKAMSAHKRPVVRPIHERYGRDFIGLKPAEVIRLGIKGYDFYKTNNPQQLPKNVYAYSHQTPIALLADMFLHYVKSPVGNIPMEFKDEVDEYGRRHEGFSIVKPPVISKFVNKVIMASATVSRLALERNFPDTAVYEIGEAGWHVEFIAYKAGSGKYALSSLSDATLSNGFQPTELKPTCKTFVDLIMREVNLYPERTHVLITIKKLVPLIKEYIGELPDNLYISNYEQEIGVYGGYLEEMETLFLLGAPFVGHDIVIQQAKKIHGSSPEPLNFQMNEDGSWEDPLLQDTEKTLVAFKMKQAFGRALPQRKPRAVVILSSVYIDGVSPRCHQFLPIDWHAAKDVRDIVNYSVPHIEAEKELELRKQSITADHSIDEVMEITTLGRRAAFYFMKEMFGEVKTQKKQSRNDQIVALHKQGHSDAEIAKALGIPRSTVYRIRKKLGL